MTRRWRKVVAWTVAIVAGTAFLLLMAAATATANGTTFWFEVWQGACVLAGIIGFTLAVLFIGWLVCEWSNR